MCALTCLLILGALYVSSAHLHRNTRRHLAKSHEIITPLTPITRSTDLVLEIPVLLSKIEDFLLDRYDCFLLDQFGVLHDGTNPLPGAIEIVNLLIKKGKRVVVTSNTSQRAKTAKTKWNKLGFPPVSDFITSGEFAYQYLKKILWW